MTKIKLTTYNVHEAIGTDKIYDLKRIEKIIYDINSDIIGLQELRLNDLKEIKIYFKKNKLNSLFIPTFKKPNGLFGNALLTKYEILDHHDLDLDDIKLSDKIEKRKAILAKLKIEKNKFLWVIVSHIAVNRTYRNLQGKVLHNEIKKRINLEKDPSILLIDFNEWMFSSFLIRQMNKIFYKKIDKRSFPTFCPIIKLDKIWITKHFKIINSYIYKNSLTRKASDHYPLVAEIEF